MRKILALLLALLMLAGSAFAQVMVDGYVAATDETLVEYGYDYYLTEEVALYLHAFCELPPNFITKDEAYDYGWKSKSYALWDVAYGMCIGGDVFGNREGLLPKAKGRTWYECDVNFDGEDRGAERIVFSTDGLIYYTHDHYESFELLYDGWYDASYAYDPNAYGSYVYSDPYDSSYNSGWGDTIGGLLGSLFEGAIGW